MLSAQELFKSLKEEQSQIEALEADVLQKKSIVKSQRLKLDELENVVASYDKDLLETRAEYTKTMEKHTVLVGQVTEEKKKQYALHLQLLAAEEDRKAVVEALLQEASNHATALRNLALSRLPNVIKEPKILKELIKREDEEPKKRELHEVAPPEEGDEDLLLVKKPKTMKLLNIPNVEPTSTTEWRAEVM